MFVTVYQHTRTCLRIREALLLRPSLRPSLRPALPLTCSLIPMATCPTLTCRRSRILRHSPWTFSIQMSTPGAASDNNKTRRSTGVCIRAVTVRPPHLQSSRKTADWPRPTTPDVLLSGCCRRRRLQSSDHQRSDRTPSKGEETFTSSLYSTHKNTPPYTHTPSKYRQTHTSMGRAHTHLV